MADSGSRTVGRKRALTRERLEAEIRKNKRLIYRVAPLAAFWLLCAAAGSMRLASERPNSFLWLAWMCVCGSACWLIEVHDLGERKRRRWAFVAVLLGSALLGVPVLIGLASGRPESPSWLVFGENRAGKPNSPGWLIDGGVIVSAVCLIWAGRDLQTASFQLKDFRTGMRHRVALVHRLLAGSPFILYLRDFASEGALISLPGPEGSSLARANPDGDSLVKMLGGEIPIFGLLSYEQVLPIDIQLVTVDMENWFDKFQLYGSRAALIVVHCEAAGDGLMREIKWIEENRLGSRTLLLASRRALSLPPLASIGPQMRWVVETSDDWPRQRRQRLYGVSLPSDVRDFVVSSGTPSAPPRLTFFCSSPALLQLDDVLYCEVIEQSLARIGPGAAGTYLVTVDLQRIDGSTHLLVGKPTPVPPKSA